MATSLFTSADKHGAAAGQPISLDVTGRSQLRLWSAPMVQHHDHADWADARLTCNAGERATDTYHRRPLGFLRLEGRRADHFSG